MIAIAALIGLPARRVADCKDAFELATYAAVITRAEKILGDWREDLANRIANAVSELFKG